MKKEIAFTKMQGIGNDYIYVSCLEEELENLPELARKLADRHFGIGGDGLVLILPSTGADFRMRMFNPNGSEAEMCGNAIRCVGKYLFDRGLTDQSRINIETGAGIRTLELTVEDQKVSLVRVNMGKPVLQAEEIPVEALESPVINLPVSLEGQELKITCISMGNPHAVCFVDRITNEHVLGLGPLLEMHPLFPRKANVEFVRILNRSEVEMRVWERGAGETLACGTGAAAVVVAAVLNELTDRRAVVHLLGGDLEIEWAVDGSVFKTGPAEFVFDGVVSV